MYVIFLDNDKKSHIPIEAYWTIDAVRRVFCLHLLYNMGHDHAIRRSSEFQHLSALKHLAHDIRVIPCTIYFQLGSGLSEYLLFCSSLAAH